MNAEDIEVAVTVSALTRIPVLRELNLELHLILRDGSSADRARGPTPGPPHSRSGWRFGILRLSIATRAL